jgi:hypothetical protein
MQPRRERGTAQENRALATERGCIGTKHPSFCDSEVAEAEGHKNKERANAVIHHRNRKESRA